MSLAARVSRRNWLASIAAAAALKGQGTGKAPLRSPDVPYVPTPQPVVEAMLKLGEVKQGDVLFDLGSGDGRIPITAAKMFGIRATGIDINPVRISEAEANAKKEGVADKVHFLNQDLFETDISSATVVTLYLLPSLNMKLRPRLWTDLKAGTRIVSHSFDMGEWEPEKRIEVEGRYLYLWRVPTTPPRLKVAG